MHIKWLNRGAGSCKAAIDYILSEKDHLGQRREIVKVLRGDPESVAYFADTSGFKYKYSSCVVAWAPEDRPTKEQVEEFLSAFERVAFPGMRGRVPWCAVLHDSPNGGVHLHIVVARLDLLTGKSFNPAPPGWQKTYDPLRDYFNVKYGWARPDDLRRAVLVYVDKHRDKGKGADIKRRIGEALWELAKVGRIRNRDDVIRILERGGFKVVRKGKNYLTVEYGKKRIRLRGRMFCEDFKWVYDEKEKTRILSKVQGFSSGVSPEAVAKDTMNLIELLFELFLFGKRKLSKFVRKMKAMGAANEMIDEARRLLEETEKKRKKERELEAILRVLRERMMRIREWNLKKYGRIEIPEVSFEVKPSPKPVSEKPIFKPEKSLQEFCEKHMQKIKKFQETQSSEKTQTQNQTKTKQKPKLKPN